MSETCIIKYFQGPLLLTSNKRVPVDVEHIPFDENSKPWERLVSIEESNQLFKDNFNFVPGQMPLDTQSDTQNLHKKKLQICPHAQVILTNALWGFKMVSRTNKDHILSKHADCCELCTIGLGCQ